MKREPLLADLVLAARKTLGRRTYGQKFVDRHLDNLQTCKRFVLDPQAAQYLGQSLSDNPYLLADAQDFAIPPFNRMWVELPFKSLFFGTNGHAPDPLADELWGVLFDGPEVTVFAGGPRTLTTSTREIGPELYPVQYLLHRPWTFEQELRFCQVVGINRMSLDNLFWGSTFYRVRSMGDTPEATNTVLRSLRANHSMRLVPGFKTNTEGVMIDHESGHSFGEFLLRTAAGDLRTIIGLLIFLNRTADMQVHEPVKASQGWVGRQPRPYVSHSVISLRLDPRPRLASVTMGEAQRKRLHDVRGHFCHDRRARSASSWCAHEHWEETRPLHWECQSCKGQRWWRKEHQRGSFDEGVVVQEYAVTR